jgi:hypothetical protein
LLDLYTTSSGGVCIKYYKIGNFWKHIPDKEHYAECPTCKVEESMEHVMIDCTAPGQAEVWHLAKVLWSMKGKEWPTISFGTALSCGISRILGEDYNKWDNRLFRILVSESAYFIWKLRCKRRIPTGDNPEAQHTTQEIQNRWLQMINGRLTLERLLTDKRRYGKKALSVQTVIKTWDGVLLDRTSLPDNWIKHNGVLVGIRPLCPPG